MLNTTKAQRRKIKKALRERDISYVIKAAFFHARLSHYFVLERLGYKMKVFYTPFSFWLWTEGRERSDELFYKSFLRPGDTVVDAGANVGLCTLLSAKSVGESGHVYSFEPHPRTFNHLKKNVAVNKLTNVTLYNFGLGDKEEEVNFTNEYVTDINHVDNHGTCSVKLTRLDTLLKHVTEITLLKIDVEGYELFALQGAKDVLLKTRCIYFESAPRSFERYGYELKDIYDLLSLAGFCLYKLEKNDEVLKIHRDYITLSGYENILALRQRDVPFLEKRLQQSIIIAGN